MTTNTNTQDKIATAIALIESAATVTGDYLKTITVALSTCKGLSDNRIPVALVALANGQRSADMVTLRGFLVASIGAVEWCGTAYKSKIKFVKNAGKSEVLKPSPNWKIGAWFVRPVCASAEPTERTLTELEDRSGAALKSARASLLSAAAKFSVECKVAVSDTDTMSAIAEQFSAGALVITAQDILDRLAAAK